MLTTDESNESLEYYLDSSYSCNFFMFEIIYNKNLKKK